MIYFNPVDADAWEDHKYVKQVGKAPLETPPRGALAVGRVSFEVYSFGSRLCLVFLSLLLSTELIFKTTDI